MIKQGAEAKVYISTLFPAPIMTFTSSDQTGRATDSSYPEQTQAAKTLLKYRFPKTYRHQTLSSHLTSTRTTAEARALVRCSKAEVNTPGIVCVDDVQGVLGLELIEGRSVRELLGGGSEGDELEKSPSENELAVEGEGSELSEKDAIQLMKLIGEQIAKMHLAHVIHGDLTTSNMMARKKISGAMEIVSRRRAFRDARLYKSCPDVMQVLIDFGLSNTSTWPEDKAVDLYVLEKAFQSTHPSSDHLFSEILRSYQTTLESAHSAIGSVAQFERKKGQAKAEKGIITGQTIWKDIARKLEDGEWLDPLHLPIVVQYSLMLLQAKNFRLLYPLLSLYSSAPLIPSHSQSDYEGARGLW